MKLEIFIAFALAGCGGAAFSSVDDVVDASGDALDAGADRDVADAGTTDRDGALDAPALDAKPVPIDAPDRLLCCRWMDAGNTRATSCGPGDWACIVYVDGGGHRYDTCYADDGACKSGACVLNDNSHGTIFGEVTLCP